ncbi:MAG: hypothetical protein HKN22_06665, partial [Bacteroidia bacterium]|nr:hypothetical protein [Bacteroidia bacterium]
MHLKKNQLLLLYWLILLGFVYRFIGDKYGISLLFLDPEYLGVVNQWSFFVMGLASGAFVMAFHISSYILNSFRFPFLATISKTFLKFSINNFIIPVSFVCIYIFEFARFQYYEQFVPVDEVLLFVLFYMIGMWIIMLFIFRYFIQINKDLSSLFGVELSESQAMPIRKRRVRKKPRSGARRSWKVDTYLSFPLKVRLVRSTKHYKNYMLQSVFKQNHINAAVLEISIIVIFILLGLFREVEILKLPAAASVFILFTIIIMISGVLRYWLRGWANTVIILLLL